MVFELLSIGKGIERCYFQERDNKAPHQKLDGDFHYEFTDGTKVKVGFTTVRTGVNAFNATIEFPDRKEEYLASDDKELSGEVCCNVYPAEGDNSYANYVEKALAEFASALPEKKAYPFLAMVDKHLDENKGLESSWSNGHSWRMMRTMSKAIKPFVEHTRQNM